MKATLSSTVLAFALCSAAQAQTPSASYALCAACHAPDGKGISAGTATPMAPALAGSKLATNGNGELLASIVFTGIAKEDAKFLGMMAPLGPMMKDEDMAAVLTYIRQNFGNTASPVTVEQVRAWREKYNGKPMQKRAELEKKSGQGG